MPSTYTPIASTTLATDTATITFSSISGTYTDLRLIITADVASATTDYFALRFNGDTGNNYSFTWLGGTSSGAQTGRFAGLNQNLIGWATSNSENASFFAPMVVDIMNYSNTTTRKSLISRNGWSTLRADINVNSWNNTNAITSISLATWGSGTFGGVNMRAGSTFTLYGIKAA
jgi:hypothetical protein